MAKVRIKAGKDDVAKSEDQGDFVLAPKGVYVLELKECNPGYAKGDDEKPDTNRPYLECIWKIVGVGREGTKPTENYGNVWDYVTFGEDSGWKRAQFGQAVGVPVKNGEIDGEVEVEEGKPGTIIGKQCLARIKHEKGRTAQDEPRAKIGWMGARSGPALSDDPMASGDDGGAEEPVDPFADTGGDGGEEEPWTEEQLQELDLKALGAEAKENWDLTPQDYIVKVRGKVHEQKTKDALIAAILEVQNGPEEEQQEAAAQDENPDDPF